MLRETELENEDEIKFSSFYLLTLLIKSVLIKPIIEGTKARLFHGAYIHY